MGGGNGYMCPDTIVVNGTHCSPSPFTVHLVTSDRSEAGPSPACRAHTSGTLTHACRASYATKDDYLAP
eukprot:354639-Chlamydomonas_euryale.AAC.5